MSDEKWLQPKERIDFLHEEALKIIQSKDVFSFSMDAVLLAKFAYVPIQKGRLIDLCSGNGVIPLFLSQRTKGQIEAVEIQERLYDMASRSVQMNGLEDRIKLHHMDLKEAPTRLGYGQFDVVTCNPPYMPVQTGKQHDNLHYAIARHELMCTLEDVIRVSSQLVRQGGRVALVHRPNRLVDILTLMRQYRIEPKRLRFIHPKADKEANMLLIEGMKDGQPDLKLMPALVAYTENNTYTPEMERLYSGELMEMMG
ncbi:tRNA1(Val) (adenine(37)-N6)-methyltransferase [Bacillus horti]|uniref:tRNA1(Val) A37 N6-methylase TrmN6 n=1 Tax=Caldalkalibacillus horti TaxID=77523 RepID=A0ABT9W2V0_9BACI|nr:tRNA1(Val) (adenine(37)-N6)-methyltransferase [Bacillus horti]MDQ0167561.1 tRNA1(Val) A37 N6-methylase TrmN6 [Bacillus horti]